MYTFAKHAKKIRSALALTCLAVAAVSGPASAQSSIPAINNVALDQKALTSPLVIDKQGSFLLGVVISSPTPCRPCRPMQNLARLPSIRCTQDFKSHPRLKMSHSY